MIGETDLHPQEASYQDQCDSYVKGIVTPDLLRKLDRNEIPYPEEFIRAMGKAGYLGVNVPAHVGGPGKDILHDALVSEVTGYHGTATMACARTFTAHIGYVLSRYGSESIRRNYLLPMLAGDVIACQGMTEPGAGSDLSAIQTTLVRDGNGWRLNGQKRFVDGAQTAGFMLAAARLGKSEDPRNDFVAVIVDTRDPGFLIREVQCDWHGFRGMGSAWVELRNVYVRDDQIVGEPGAAWKIFMEELAVERVVMTRAQLGQARRALEIAVNYALSRKTFGKPLIEHQTIAFRIAQAAAKLDAAYLLNTRAARLLDQGYGRKAELEVSMAKYLGTEYAWEVADEALQIIGGIGYTTKYPVERIQRDTRAARLTGGSSEMMQMLIARNVIRKLRDEAFDAARVGNELDGSPVFRDWGRAPEPFHPSEKVVLPTVQPTER
jgi:alkylation response protein AidB-like acyl-CoA dehydrogenase